MAVRGSEHAASGVPVVTTEARLSGEHGGCSQPVPSDLGIWLLRAQATFKFTKER